MVILSQVIVLLVLFVITLFDFLSLRIGFVDIIESILVYHFFLSLKGTTNERPSLNVLYMIW